MKNEFLSQSNTQRNITTKFSIPESQLSRPFFITEKKIIVEGANKKLKAIYKLSQKF